MKRIVCMGGGPAGLYAAILFKKALPRAEVEIFERNRPDDTFGWGVVFSDKTMGNFLEADEPSHARIVEDFHHWDDIDVHFKGQTVRSGGHGFAGISRRTLLNILQKRAASLGVKQWFQRELDNSAQFDAADLLVIAEGANSAARAQLAAQFDPTIEVRKCRYIWLGTTQKFSAFTFAFEKTAFGWFQIHAYQFSKDLSTVIVETREETWAAHGLDRASIDESIAFCEKLFSAYLGNAPLLSNARHLRGSAWLNFNRVACANWHDGRRVLIGDAAHTAHFSIGSGTKLAMEDAISLVKHVSHARDVQSGLVSYQAERNVEAQKLQNAARNRMEWFENVARYENMEPLQFAYSLLSGSQRIGHENLKLRDPHFIGRIEADMAARCGAESRPRPPMFLSFRLRGMQLVNRVVVSPMAQYRALDGEPNDWHLVHYGARATGGAGLLFTEMTCTSADARISPGCTGIWNETQAAAWRRIVEFVHKESLARICLQLGHAGRKGSTQLGWQQPDHPLEGGNWPLLAPSPLPYLPGISQVPAEMTPAQMAAVEDDFVRAAKLGISAGFDMLELHMAHGYLLASFLSPLTNVRHDEYGGSVENRLRFPLEVLRAVRAAWPAEKPLSVRLSACDWVEGGLSEEDVIKIARTFAAAGADILDISSGQTVATQRPVYGRMWQTPLADMVRNLAGVPTIAVGNIFEADHVNSIIAAGRADLCALARPHLAHPSWTLAEAAAQGFTGQWWPDPYLPAKSQLERAAQRAAATSGAA
ncbi:MAG TPA: bifunctional salicylyl-CoA 5-hydroxylase/oxidoreductase [Steroidobacteraceae bacterium]|jgi:anthraniloyl-CoA monooxygenase|nr:bifunctional salicylyl-CoA 5-hydroxylase/oxidoreductase [Steroidobacteraceae bacterium]